MTRWRPDPTFYPSPRHAADAPREELAYVTLRAGAALGAVVPWRAWRYGVAGLLTGFGCLPLARPWHPSYGGMRIGAGQLVMWSALMTTAHGAGLMLLPFVSRSAPALGSPTMPMAHAGMISPAEGALEWPWRPR